MNKLQAIREALADGRACSSAELVEFLGLDIDQVRNAITKLIRNGDLEAMPKRYALTSVGAMRSRNAVMRAGVTEEERVARRTEKQRQYTANRKARLAAVGMTLSEAYAAPRRAAKKLLAAEKRAAKLAAKQAAEAAELAELAAKQSIRAFTPIADDAEVSRALAKRPALDAAWGGSCNV